MQDLEIASLNSIFLTNMEKWFTDHLEMTLISLEINFRAHMSHRKFSRVEKIVVLSRKCLRASLLIHVSVGRSQNVRRTPIFAALRKILYNSFELENRFLNRLMPSRGGQ